jgi:hypothetical protein
MARNVLPITKAAEFHVILLLAKKNNMLRVTAFTLEWLAGAGLVLVVVTMRIEEADGCCEAGRPLIVRTFCVKQSFITKSLASSI